jgi:hypothetical protein
MLIHLSTFPDACFRPKIIFHRIHPAFCNFQRVARTNSQGDGFDLAISVMREGEIYSLGRRIVK